MFPEIDSGGSRNALAGNVMHFARLLRGAGLRLGPDRVVDCVKALELSGSDHVLFRRNSVSGAIEAVPWKAGRIELNAALHAN